MPGQVAPMSASGTAPIVPLVVVDCTNGPVNVMLPPPAATATSPLAAIGVTIKKIDTTANPVLVQGNAGESIDGGPTKTIANPQGSFMFLTDGVNWFSI